MNDHDPLPYPEGKLPAISTVMMPRDTNALGTIFGGVILSYIDLAAAIEAHKYHSGKIVTVAMDEIVFKRPVHVGDLVAFFTDTLRIGTTSVTVSVSVWAQRRFGSKERIPVTQAEVTLVAVNDSFQKVPISRPESE